MKAITEKKWSDGQNAWGQSCYSAQQTFEVEPSDVDTQRHNWRGQGHSTYKFTSSDVGRKISVHTDKTGWTCWVFDSATVAA